MRPATVALKPERLRVPAVPLKSRVEAAGRAVLEPRARVPALMMVPPE